MSQSRNLLENLLDLELLLAERPRSQSELVSLFGVNRKTVKRAVDRLSLKRLITEEKQGRHIVYSAEDFEPLALSSTELRLFWRSNAEQSAQR